MAAVDPGRGVTIARLIGWSHTRWSTLARVARVVTAADPGYGEAIARSIENASYQSAALADLAHLQAEQGISWVALPVKTQRKPR